MGKNAPKAQSEEPILDDGFVTIDCSSSCIRIGTQYFDASNGKVTIPKELEEEAIRICG